MHNTGCAKKRRTWKMRALKMVNISQQDNKTASKASYLTCQSWGLVNLDWNIEKENA